MNLQNIEARTFMLIDAVGAMVSVIVLGFILPQFESFFGIPRPMLYFLAAIPVLYIIYDLYCYFNIKGDLSKCLKGIAIANLVYCLISVTGAFIHREQLSKFGWVYIGMEVSLIILIAVMELRVARKE